MVNKIIKKIIEDFYYDEDIKYIQCTEIDFQQNFLENHCRSILILTLPVP